MTLPAGATVDRTRVLEAPGRLLYTSGREASIEVERKDRIIRPPVRA